MLDLFNTTSPENINVYYTHGSGSNNWQTWNKPDNCKMVQIFAVGGGAGGGWGYSRAFAGATGGSGGGAATTALGTFPANVLPDTLYVQVGAGGAGGNYTAGTTGTNGSISYICTEPTQTAAYIVLASGNTPPTFGANGTTGIAPAVGTAGSVFTTAGKFTSFYGDITTMGASVAQAGGVGASTMASVGITNIVGLGGRGGAGNTGGPSPDTTGQITGNGIIPTTRGGVTSASAAGNGDHGFVLADPSNLASSRYTVYATAGCGGGSSTGTTSGCSGGRGGNGAWGCGGGGGGASFAGPLNAPGGDGGNGGDGFVIIAWA